MVESNNNEDSIAGVDQDRSGVTTEQAQDGRKAGVTPGTDVHAYIGRQLRAVYDDVAKQPIPDRFLDLMQQLETKGTG